MKKLLSIPAYLWAIICMLLIPVTFMGSSGFARELAKLPFMKIHPAFSGGEADRSYLSDSLTITVNKPVFPALFGESKNGFVQVKFSGRKPLPPMIRDTIDYNKDGSADFTVGINTTSGETSIHSLNEKVQTTCLSAMVKEAWIVRVDLKR
jgi:hypothetical protein